MTKFHTSIRLTELRHGGQKSAGISYVLDYEYDHYTADELIAKLNEATNAGQRLTINVLGVNDKRKPEVQQRYPNNPCPECEALFDAQGGTDA